MAKSGSWGVSIFLLVLALLGLFITSFAALEVYRYGLRLPNDRVITKAVADEFRTVEVPRRRIPRHELRYHFTVVGHPETFTREDDFIFFRRTNLWVTVPKDAWEEARSSGDISVAYLREDPSVNRPLESQGSVFGPIAGGVVGLLLLVLGILGLLPRKKPVQATSTPPS